jgi:hypothetical protein
MADYDRSRWLVPIPGDPDAEALIRRMASTRLAGSELKQRRPHLTLRMVADERFALAIKPRLASSPTGWTLSPLIDVTLSARDTGKTEIKLTIKPDGTMNLTLWHRDDARTQAAVGLVRETLDRLTHDPRRAFAYGATQCAFCGRALVDPKSIDIGIGPECFGLFQLAIKRDEARMERMEGRPC